MGLKSSKTHLLFWKTLKYQLYFSKAEDVCYNLLGSTKNCEGFQILPYLQTNKLAWHSFMGAGRKKQDSWIKDKGQFIAHSNTSGPFQCLCQFPGIQFPRVTRRGHVTPAPVALGEREARRVGNLNLPQSLISKSAEALLGKMIWPLLQKTLSKPPPLL